MTRGIVIYNTSATLSSEIFGDVTLSEDREVTLGTYSAYSTAAVTAGTIVVESGGTFDDSTGVNITGNGKVQRN